MAYKGFDLTSRRRVVAVGALFLTITTALYGLYIIGIYSVLSYVAYLTWIQRAVAVLAAAFAIGCALAAAIAARRVGEGREIPRIPREIPR